jgi:YedE family putative selenium metabolism protein
MFRDFSLISGFVAVIVTVLAGNLLLGQFTGFSFADQPVAHADSLWNFLGMALVGWCAILLGGCPLRQLVLAGEGNSDSAITVLGMLAGAALSHNFKLASSADGPTGNGKVAVIAGFVIVAVISLVFTYTKKKER